MTRLELKNGIKFYVSGHEITKALQDINVSFQTGEFVAITGESGSGKSTLAHILAGVFPCDKGVLYLNGESSNHYGDEEWEAYRRDTISFIAQDYGILPGNTVLDNVISALALAGLTKEEAKARAEKLLRQVDLWELRRRRAARLSSGQKQRLSIARAVAKPAPVLVADEPTSNLDAGNTENIVRLFQEEAKTRLVIMVTHNYDAVEAQVTRHIEIQNGKIVADEVLREPVTSEDKPAESGKTATGGTPFSLGRHIAGLQLKARPVWTMLMTAFFALTAFAVFAFLGTFIVALDDTATRYYNNGAFLNGDSRRLAVLKEDGSEFSNEEYQMLVNMEYVDYVERYGVVTDINYYYRKDADYVVRIVQNSGSTTSDTSYVEEIVLRNHTLFAQTVPVLTAGEEFLTAGRLPEHFHEVVAAGGEEMLGETITVYIRDGKNWGNDTYIAEEMTVVGVTDHGSGLYFDDRLGVMFWQISRCKDRIGSYFYGIDREMTGNQYSLPEKAAPLVLRELRKAGSLKLLNLRDGSVLEAEYAGTAKRNHQYFIGFSEEMFDTVSCAEGCNQVSVFLKDYSYTDRVREKLKEMGYEVISTYQLGAVMQNEQLGQERMTTLVLCLLALLIVLIAQAVVLSSMFGTEIANYRQLRTLGLTYRDGKASVSWQVAVLTLVGQLLGGGLVWIMSAQGAESFVRLTKYLLLWQIPILVAVHAAASVLVVLVVRAGLKEKVFPFLPRSYEVDLSELDAERESEE